MGKIGKTGIKEARNNKSRQTQTTSFPLPIILKQNYSITQPSQMFHYNSGLITNQLKTIFSN